MSLNIEAILLQNIKEQYGSYAKSIHIFLFDGDNWWTTEATIVL
jgi:hypothetical protein